MKKPRALRPGDTIGIVAPSGPIPPADLEQGIAHLQARGYRVEVGEHVLARHPAFDYLAGTDAQRAGDLNAMLARTDVQAILCARGGYGAMRLFDRIDWESVPSEPKLFIGYSDITSLHTAIAGRLGWSSFYGPMVGSLMRLNELSAQVAWHLLEKPEPLGTLPADPAVITTVAEGQVEGRLAGGCLCLLAHACGSGYAPDFRDKIVVLEDVGEAVYRIDRDLAQLKNAGLLDQAVGFVIGHVTRWRQHEADPPNNTPDALWQDYFGALGKPVITGYPFGHEPDPLMIPLGIQARLDADVRTLTLLESATHDLSPGESLR